MAKHKHASHVVDGKWHAITVIQCVVAVEGDLTAVQRRCVGLYTAYVRPQICIRNQLSIRSYFTILICSTP
jgi:hypothetical protein